MKLHVAFLAAAWWAAAAVPPRGFVDRTHVSTVLGEARHYRLFLPPGYAGTKQAYPVIYYFHGHSDRYTLEKYDDGKDTVPKIVRFVASHPVIVVAVDGFVAADYTGFYGGAPWDVGQGGGRLDFGLYFRELVAHIDATYRTRRTRRFRATAGLSMGGFMSLYLSARFPDLIGSASSFNPGPEFFIGEPGRRILWRPKDHVAAHGATMVRLIRASGDYISQYHEETHDAYARAHQVAFEFRQDEYHRHWATSIGETFEFHERAFAQPSLDRPPDSWSYSSAYRDARSWDYRLQTDNQAPGFIYLEDVSANAMRIYTRQWAPDGPPAPQSITITTAPRYTPNTVYRMRDGGSAARELRSDPTGRLEFQVDGDNHQISFEGPGLVPPPPVLMTWTTSAALRLRADVSRTLPWRIYNPRSTPIEGLRLRLTSEYPTVAIEAGDLAIKRIEPGQTVRIEPQVRFTAGDGGFEAARLHAELSAPGVAKVAKDIDVLVAPAIVPAPWQMEILDGRTLTLPVFLQKGNQGGGSTIQRTVTEGRGNGNGVLEPGEEATIWVRLHQGLDPFDKGHWYRAKVFAESPWLTEVGDIAEQKQREWTGAKERTSLIALRPDTPAGAQIPVLLENESWSFHFTPDVRYGPEPLYQAFQQHRRHLHALTLKIVDLGH